MKVLITGITGFAGSHLAEFLLLKGCEVFGISRPLEETKNLRGFVHRLQLDEVDLLESHTIERIVANINPDVIYHLAGEASVHLSGGKPADTMQVNAIGTLNLMEAVRKLARKPCVLLVTSGEVYGPVGLEELPLTEDLPLCPLHPYAMSKVVVHYLGYEYFHAHHVPVVEARPFNHIGPRQRLGFVAPDFSKQLAEIFLGMRARQIKVGDLSARRDFVDVRDVVRAYWLLTEKGKPGEVYNVCSGNAHSIQTILNMLISLSGVQVTVIVDQERLRSSSVAVMKGSCAKIQRELGWSPQIPLEQSLKDTLEYWIESLRKEEPK